MLEQYAIVPFVAQVERSVPSVAQAEKRTCSKKEECAEYSEQYAKKFARFLEPLLRELHERVDKRPLGTLVQTVEAMLAFRDSSHGLLLTELGGYLDQLGEGGGGTKRLGTLVRHEKWKAQQIDEFLLDLMQEENRTARDWLIEYACHRTGQPLRDVTLPFSRLRQALSKLWLTYPCWFVRRAALLL